MTKSKLAVLNGLLRSVETIKQEYKICNIKQENITFCFSRFIAKILHNYFSTSFLFNCFFPLLTLCFGKILKFGRIIEFHNPDLHNKCNT